MDIAQEATETARQIRDELAQEVGRAQAERTLIRAMDADGLLARASARQTFNQVMVGLQQNLMALLTSLTARLGLPETTLEGLRRRGGDEGRRLAGVLAEVRSLAEALTELDGLNRLLAERAQTFVRAHLNALAPPKSATYSRRGGTTPEPVFTTRVRVL